MTGGTSSGTQQIETRYSGLGIVATSDWSRAFTAGRIQEEHGMEPATSSINAGLPSGALDGGQDPGASASNYFKYTQLGRLYDVMGSGYGSGGANGTPAIGETYRWDALGNRLEHQQGEDAYPTVSEYHQNTTRLTRSHPPSSVSNSGQAFSTAEYDDNGNQAWFFADNYLVNVTEKSQTFQLRATRSYYGADGRLYASDGNHCYTEHAPGQQGTHCLGTGSLKNETSGAFEWYRYDALGRRVMVRTRRDHNCTSTECSSTITRFVWDGDQILYEIQAPGGAVPANELESDNFAGNQYGRVLYTHGAGIDQPLDIIRMGHTPPAGYEFEAWGGPYPIMPFGDWRGTLVGGTTAQGVKLPCPDGKCLVYWPGSRYRAFLERDRPVYQRNWFGSLTAGQENPNGLMYMRNRYYNPITGAFTQADPIGLAGGLNSYGYAEGNPVTYSDPYGLEAEEPGQCKGKIGCALQVLRAGYAAWRRSRALDRAIRSGRLVIQQGGRFSASEVRAAEEMALKGHRVVLRTPQGTRAGGGTSDLVVNGQPWDVYTPQTSNPNRIISAIAHKNDQAVGIVLDLTETSVTPAQLGNVLARVRGAGATNIQHIEILP